MFLSIDPFRWLSSCSAHDDLPLTECYNDRGKVTVSPLPKKAMQRSALQLFTTPQLQTTSDEVHLSPQQCVFCTLRSRKLTQAGWSGYRKTLHCIIVEPPLSEIEHRPVYMRLSSCMRACQKKQSRPLWVSVSVCVRVFSDKTSLSTLAKSCRCEGGRGIFSHVIETINEQRDSRVLCLLLQVFPCLVSSHNYVLELKPAVSSVCDSGLWKLKLRKEEMFQKAPDTATHNI